MMREQNEIVFLDITATHEGRKTIVDVVEKNGFKSIYSSYGWRRNFKCEKIYTIY